MNDNEECDEERLLLQEIALRYQNVAREMANMGSAILLKLRKVLGEE